VLASFFISLCYTLLGNTLIISELAPSLPLHNKVFSLDHGVCSLCGIDAHAAWLQVEAG
jgi:hypothetical protein